METETTRGGVSERHEKRPDAEVCVIGAGERASPAEWYCARLMWAMHHLPLVIDVTEPARVYAGNEEPRVGGTRATRDEAVAACTEELLNDVRSDAAQRENRAHRLAQEAAGLQLDSEKDAASAAALRALIASAPKVGDAR